MAEQNEIVIDTKAFVADMKHIRDEQIPFALKNALNDVGIEIQDAERRHMRDIFDERRPDWLDRSVKITHFATKRAPWLTIGIHPPGAKGESRADVLTKFETEREKRPFKGKFVAVPTGAKRSKKDIVLRSQRPSSFNFRRDGKRILGEKRTFIVKKSAELGLILQRLGRRGGSRVRSLYMLIRTVPIEPDLHFEKTASIVVAATMEEALTRRIDEAMRTAK